MSSSKWTTPSTKPCSRSSGPITTSRGTRRPSPSTTVRDPASAALPRPYPPARAPHSLCRRIPLPLSVGCGQVPSPQAPSGARRPHFGGARGPQCICAECPAHNSTARAAARVKARRGAPLVQHGIWRDQAAAAAAAAEKGVRNCACRAARPPTPRAPRAAATCSSPPCARS